MSDLASSIVDDIFADLRDRRFLKWLFDAKGDECLIGRFADGEELRGLDLEVQQDIRTAWTSIIASRISQQDAELERLRREVEEARGAIAWANNSLFGSHGFFLSLDGGEPDEHHLDRAIEDMKARNRAHFAQLSEARKGAFVEAAEMFDQNRSWGGRDVAADLRAKAEETGHE